MALLSFLQQWLEKQQWMLLQHPLLLSLLLLFSFFFLLRIGYGPNSSKSNLPPSPPKFPIIGNIHQLGPLIHRSFRDLSQKYGPIMLLHMGGVPVVVVSSGEIVREITKDHDVNFANRPFTTAAHALLYGCTDVGFSPYGEHWRKLRRICVMELLTPKRVHSFKSFREEEIGCLLEKIKAAAAMKNSPIDLSKMFFVLSNDIVSRCAVGKKHGEKDKFRELSRQLSELIPAFSFGDFFPYLKWMDVLTGLVRRLKITSQELDAFFEQVLEEHVGERNHNDGEYLNKENDCMDLLLKVQENNQYINLTKLNIKALIQDLFIAGSETTATTLEWTMAELIKNPDIMKKAQEEVRRVTGHNKCSKVEEEDIKQMDYLKCIINESLRLHPAIPTLLPHQSSKACTVGGYHIPAKTRVMINAWAIQRDPKVWSRAEEFIPDRFINSTIDFKGQDYNFIPFGSGRRMCPGSTFALAIVESAIANLLYWFDWELPNGAANEELDMTEAFGLSVAKKIPLKLVPIYHFS
ncbi:hypothetical protein Sjap_016300 [Stephania japonica]|uniref:Cytochrome P450 n=1 Tax=Stephania japonica TaxID=461633 RepID=A0AAP0NS88_9MAGN